MTTGDQFTLLVLDRDRFDPVNRVLKNEGLPKLEQDLVRQHWVRWTRPDVQKERPVVSQHPMKRRRPLAGPRQVFRAARGVVISAVTDAEVVRRRRDAEVNGLLGQGVHALDA